MIQVFLSNGDKFYVDAEIIQVAARLYKGRRREAGLVNHLVYLGNRLVNPAQIVELRAVRPVEVDSMYTPEKLEEVN